MPLACYPANTICFIYLFIYLFIQFPMSHSIMLHRGLGIFARVCWVCTWPYIFYAWTTHSLLPVEAEMKQSRNWKDFNFIITLFRVVWRHVNKVKLVTLIDGGPKAPFSIATTLRCRGGHYTFSWIASLYSWSLPVPYILETYSLAIFSMPSLWVALGSEVEKIHLCVYTSIVSLLERIRRGETRKVTPTPKN